MTKTPKHLLSKVQGILRKGTAKLLCVILLISLLATSCKKTPLSDELQDDPSKTEITLPGTSWKLVGIVDPRTENLKVLEPNDCEECYTLTFLTDSTLSGQGVNILLYRSDDDDINYPNYINYPDYTANYILSTIRFHFYIPAIDEPYDGNRYWSVLFRSKKFELSDTELKLYHEWFDCPDDCYGYGSIYCDSSHIITNYLLFKRMLP